MMASTRQKIQRRSVDDLQREYKEAGAETFLGAEFNEQTYKNELSELQNFINKNSDKRLKKDFIQVGEYHFDGAHNKQVVGEKLEFFKGLSLDLSTSRLVGKKPFFKVPYAEGEGGMITFAPSGFYTSMSFPLRKLYMHDGDIIKGEAMIGSSIGLGNYHKLYAADFSFVVHHNSEQNEFKFENLALELKDVKGSHLPEEQREKSEIEFYKEVKVDETGFQNSAQERGESRIFENEGFSNERMRDLLNFYPVASQNNTGNREGNSAKTVTPQPANTPAETVTPQPANTPAVNSLEKQEKVASFSNGSMKKKGGNVTKYYDTLIIYRTGSTYNGKITHNNHTHTLENITLESNGEFSSESVQWDGEESKSQKLFKYIMSKIADGAGETSAHFVYKELHISKDGTIEYGKRIVTFEHEKDLTSSENEDDSSNVEKTDMGAIFDLITKELVEYGKDESGESSNEVAVPLFVVPIIPAVTFDVSAYANYETGYKLATALSGLNFDTDEKAFNIEDGVGLKLAASVTGKAAAGLKASLTAGQKGIASIVASLAAELSLSGKGEGNELLTGEAEATLGSSNEGKLFIESLNLKAEAYIELKAAIKAAIEGNFLIWSKTLYSVTFAEWNLGSISAEIEASKNVREKGKWVTSAQASYKNISGDVKTKMDDKKAFEGLMVKNDEKMIKVRDNLSDFNELKRTFSEASEFYKKMYESNKIVLVDNSPDSNFYKMNQLVVSVENKFYEAAEKKKALLEEQFKMIHSLSSDKLHLDTISGSALHENALKETSDLLVDIQKHSKDASLLNQLKKLKERSNSSSSRPFEKKKFDEYLEEKKQTQYRSVKRLLDHENARLEEKKKGTEKRQSDSINYAKEKKIPSEKFSVGLRDYYKGMKGNWYASNKVRFADIHRLLEAEVKASQKTQNSKEYRNVSRQIELIQKKYMDITAMGKEDKINPEFLELFQTGPRKLDYQKDMANYGSIKWVIKYLKGIVPEKSSEQIAKRNAVKSATDITSLPFYSKISDPKGELYKTATRKDVIELYRQQRQRAFIEEKLKGEKKRNEALYNMILDRVDIDVLIAFEEGRVDRNNTDDLLLENLKSAKNVYEDRAVDVALRCDTVAKAMKAYFYESSIDFGTGKEIWKMRKKNALLSSVEKGRNSHLLSSSDILEDGGTSLEDNDAGAYALMHQYSLTLDGKINAHANHEAMNKFLEEKGRHNSLDPSMAKQYYDYDARSESNLVDNVDHLSLLNHFTKAQKKKEDYATTLLYLKSKPEFFKSYTKFLIKNEKDIMTPKDLYEYEKRAHQELQSGNQSSMLTKAITSKEDHHIVREKYQGTEGGKLYDNEEGICLQDILFIESTITTKEVKKHQNRIAILTDSTLTDEEKVSRSADITLQGEKDAVKEMIEAITSNPIELAKELNLYEQLQVEQYREVIEAREATISEIKTTIQLLSAQTLQCESITTKCEESLRNPEKIFGQDSEIQNYINNVLGAGQEHISTLETLSKDGGA